MKNGKSNPMKTVAKKTGLSAHVIRAWEKRYNAIAPMRTKSNHRLYSDEDILRLSLLKAATDAGHSISSIAQLPTEELQVLVGSVSRPVMPDAASSVPVAAAMDTDSAPDGMVKECLAAVKNFDARRLENLLLQASVMFSQPTLIDEVVVPFIAAIGHMWQVGELRIVHEHLSSHVIHAFLSSLKSAVYVPELAPRMIITTPAGQQHELGALIVALTAVSHGWHATYLGPNLPAEEIAAAAIKNRAKTVCLSLVYPLEDMRTTQQLLQLRALLPEGTEIVAGGRAAPSYKAVLEQIGASIIVSIPGLRTKLETV